MKIHFGQKHDTIRSTTVECDYCGEEVEKLSQNVERNENNFCDNSCYGKWRSELTGRSNPKYDRIKVECQNCSGELSIQENKFDRNDNHFCDNDCYNTWMRRNIDSTDIKYGDNWDQISSKIRSRDGACVECELSNDECVEKYGCKLHVHHIKPLRTFDDPSAANKKENLISLCPACHSRVEHNDT